MTHYSLPDKRPVFICGLARSGTGWLLRSLEQSKELVSVHEAWLLCRLMDLAKWQKMLHGEWQSSTWHKSEIAPEQFRELLGSSYEQMLLAVSKGKRFVEKTPGWNIEYLDFLTSLCPDAYFVVIYRDGRNQVASHETKRGIVGDQSYDFAAACRRWAKVMEVVGRYAAGTQKARTMIVRYEDMLESFDARFDEICRFVEIAPFQPEQPVPNTSFPGQPADFNRRWMDWSEEKKEIFKQAAGKELEQWGYASDSRW